MGISVKERLAGARLYCVTRPPSGGRTYKESVESACRGGADIVQLREKKLSAKELVSLARELKEICARYSALFIVNDCLDSALEAGADGVHLGQNDLPLEEARKIAAGRVSKFIIGCSTHSIEQALSAEALGADYIGCGPIFQTPTKPDTPAVGLDLIREYRERIHIPFVAIGGIDETNVDQVRMAGGRAIAVVRAVFDSRDIEGACRSLKNKIIN